VAAPAAGSLLKENAPAVATTRSAAVTRVQLRRLAVETKDVANDLIRELKKPTVPLAASGPCR
jgi:hypothetical protein